MPINLKNRHFLKLLDFSSDEIRFMLKLAADLKTAKYTGNEKPRLLGKNIALIFEKESTRTRCAFEVAAQDQGAHATYLGPSGSHIGVKETMKDTARVLGRMYDGIEYRGFGQSIVEELAEYAGVPVWNGLTDEFHPTQALADFLTIMEHTSKPLDQVVLTYMGDGRNNVANSLLVASAKLGCDFRIGAPAKYHPSPELMARCEEVAATTKARLKVTEDPNQAVEGADFLYTDVWVSMGEAASLWEERIAALRPYQINAECLRRTGNPNVKFLHCLPAFHNSDTKIGREVAGKYGLENGMEVTEDVFESRHSVVFDEAENRVHTIKAVMVATLGS
ncbi:MAG: ornithine carbamoyltransferase [Candidatus Xenobium sp.]|jgi:ornithine carbamoyltransferase|nr:ornithine carbamoyltransferase [Burkholderiales bacterium]